MERRIDVDLVLRTIAANAMIGNQDSFPRQNYYIYSVPYHKRLSILPWDANGAWTRFAGLREMTARFD